jgi:DNA-directed RNA polymerase subunit N (RpoN/RPB10)
MIFAITCHCGRSIGDLYPIYNALRQEVIDEELKSLGRDISPDLTYLATDFQPKLGEILDKLEINLECCRTRFLTSVEFDDLYG